MKCIEFVAGGSSEAAKAEVTHNCCPTDFYRLKNTPEKCRGNMKNRTIEMCEKCWNQEAHPID